MSFFSVSRDDIWIHVRFGWFWKHVFALTGWWLPGFWYRFRLYRQGKPSVVLGRPPTLREAFRGKSDCES